MVIGFTTTCAIGAYHHQSCKFEPRSWRGVLDTTSYDKVCQWLATGWWFSPGTQVSSTNKTDRHDITGILLIVALNTINPLICVIFLFNLCYPIVIKLIGFSKFIIFFFFFFLANLLIVSSYDASWPRLYGNFILVISNPSRRPCNINQK